jgi:DNA-directed RNA polymerase specialized sigma24 family protein
MKKETKTKKTTITDLVLVINNQQAMIDDCLNRIKEMEEKISSLKTRDRGPKSTREMTEEDGKRIMFGDLKKLSHKEAAKELGLSYGQVYSARSGYTFRYLEDEEKKKKEN